MPLFLCLYICHHLAYHISTFLSICVSVPLYKRLSVCLSTVYIYLPIPLSVYHAFISKSSIPIFLNLSALLLFSVPLSEQLSPSPPVRSSLPLSVPSLYCTFLPLPVRSSLLLSVPPPVRSSTPVCPPPCPFLTSPLHSSLPLFVPPPMFVPPPLSDPSPLSPPYPTLPLSVPSPYCTFPYLLSLSLYI